MNDKNKWYGREVHGDKEQFACSNYYVAQLINEVEFLRGSIRKFLEGDYPHPRTYRPNQCPHEKYYWEDCDQCDGEFFEKILETTGGS